MLMIPCDRNCQNQQDGYCCLEGITSVTNPHEITEKGCLYYVRAAASACKDEPVCNYTNVRKNTRHL